MKHQAVCIGIVTYLLVCLANFIIGCQTQRLEATTPQEHARVVWKGAVEAMACGNIDLLARWATREAVADITTSENTGPISNAVLREHGKALRDEKIQILSESEGRVELRIGPPFFTEQRATFKLVNGAWKLTELTLAE